MNIGNHSQLCHYFNEYDQSHFWPAIYPTDQENKHTGAVAAFSYCFNLLFGFFGILLHSVFLLVGFFYLILALDFDS